MQSPKINDISVSNFRGIDSLKFKPKDINIIVGPNNTGKSSLLNAISLGYYALNGFYENKSEEIFDKTSLYPLDHQIYEKNENSARIFLNLVGTRKMVIPIELIIAYGEEIPRGNFNHRALNEFIELQAERLVAKEMEEAKRIITDRKYPQGYFEQRRAEIQGDIYTEFYQGCSNTLFFKLKHQNKVIRESYIENLSKKTEYRRRYVFRSPFRNYFTDLEKLHFLERKYDFSYIFRSQIKKFDIIQYFKKLSQTPNFYNVLDKLREKLYYLYDIRESEGNINIVTLGSDKSKIFVPFELMGDGFQSLLITTILFELSPRGIVLLEEPENCLHPGYMDILANTILQKSKNHQFFFSTHSLDLIKILVEKAEKTNQLDNILLLRLNRRDNKINRQILLKREILEELNEIKVDLRGF